MMQFGWISGGFLGGGFSFGKVVKTSLMVAFLAGCQTLPGSDDRSGGSASESSSAAALNLSELVEESTVNTEVERLAFEGIKALEEADYETASARFNLALKLDVRNSYIQFLNALTYHLSGLQGDNQKLVLAQTGYRIAQDFDPTNWLAAYYEGLLYTDLKDWPAAQNAFARALLLDRENPSIMYQLARASYYAQDLKTAISTLDRLQEVGPDESMMPQVHRALAITNAGANRPEIAQHYLATYSEIEPQERRVRQLERRLNSWDSFHARHQRSRQLQLAQFALPGSDDDEEEEEEEIEAEEPTESDNSFFGSSSSDTSSESDSSSDTFSSPSDFAPEADEEVAVQEEEEQLTPEDRNPMVVVDVVIIRTEDDISTSTGINLLSGLQLQFGNPLTGAPALGYSEDRSQEFVDRDDSERNRTITKAISIPAVNYSLNIANAADGRNEILARPTLVAMPGETSEFFSGVEVNAAAVSGGDGDSVSIDKEIGVKLTIQPELLEDGLVRLDVEAERTFLTNPSNSIIFEFRIDTTKTSINAAVTMGFGQTLILGGLSERERENDLDGVPYLRNVPGLNLLFSEKTTRDFNKSVLILITPRRAISIDKDREEFERQVSNFTDRESDLARLSYAYRDWFKPHSSVEQIFRHMNTNDLYIEFKTGDFLLENWSDSEAHTSRLGEVVDHVFY